MRRRALNKRYGRSLWSGEVKTHWHSTPGLFTKSAHHIARTLRSRSHDTAQAVRRLVFYINRAGHNLTGEVSAKLHHALALLEGKS